MTSLRFDGDPWTLSGPISKTFTIFQGGGPPDTYLRFILPDNNGRAYKLEIHHVDEEPVIKGDWGDLYQRMNSAVIVNLKHKPDGMVTSFTLVGEAVYKCHR